MRTSPAPWAMDMMNEPKAACPYWAMPLRTSSKIPSVVAALSENLAVRPASGRGLANSRSKTAMRSSSARLDGGGNSAAVKRASSASVYFCLCSRRSKLGQVKPEELGLGNEWLDHRACGTGCSPGAHAGGNDFQIVAVLRR